MTPTIPPTRGLVARFLSRLRFPRLFALTLVALLIDVLIPDAVPFMDEIMLAFVAALLGMIRKKRK